ncbi:MAG: membrane protein insertase YidC [Pseudomonadota bacterium]
MADNRNMLLAIAISLGIILIWQFVFIEPQMEAQREAQRQAQLQAEQTSELPNATRAPTATPGAPSDIPTAPANVTVAPTAPGATATPAAPPAEAARVPIETDAVTGSISLAGARLDDLRLKDYHVTADPESPTVTILSPVGGSANPYFAETGWVPAEASVKVPSSSSIWTLESGSKLTQDSPIVLSWDNGEGLTFRREISVDDHYLFTVRKTVTNATDAEIQLLPYSRVRRIGTVDIDGFFILHEGMIGVFGEEGLVQESYDNLAEAGVLTQAPASQGWLGITDKYWATAVIPNPGTTFTPRFTYSAPSGRPAYQADYLAAAIAVPAGGTAEAVARVFAGAKETNIIRAYEIEYGIDRFNLLIDWGWFYFITKPMYFALDYVHSIVGNFGVAILIVTVGVKLLFFPLAQRAYTSMAKMKALQPEMMKLRERYKDDKQKQQQGMMELYKKEKVNPVAGCVPILIQIPVFFALYKVLFVSIEMRHAPFFGWITDLSAPDPTSIFNLFGLLPYDPTALPIIGPFLLVGIWPIIMGITMWVQMKMNPTPPDPMQAMIFNWMPIFFTFLLATFPAGLVIYWSWNNFLSVLQQYVIMRRQGVKIELWDNITGLFKRKKAPSST